MAEFLWNKRYSTAAAVLLACTALLAALDVAARASSAAPAPRWESAIVLGLVVAAIAAARFPFDRFVSAVRLLPAAIVLLVVAVGLLWGSVAEPGYAPIGLTILAVLLMSYIGFTSGPGVALAASPVVLVTFLLASWRDPDRISLALPLVAVPAAALVAELISMINDRSQQALGLSRRHRTQLDRLLDVLEKFRKPGSLEQAADQVANAARQIFGVARATVVLRDSQGRLIPVTQGETIAEEPGLRVAALVAETIHGDEPRFVSTADSGTMLVLPLPASDAPAGAVLLHPIEADDAPFTLDLARLFATQIGIAIEHLYVIDELSRASTLDALTGIGNRRHADALKASLQPGDALVVLDLDGFKSVNDAFGHQAGDQVLQALSAHLQECLRDSDTSARLGGDEFLIVARRAHADPLAVATRVLEGWGLDRRSGDVPTPTISAGVALHQADSTHDATFERADKALFRAKQQGKNQACLWTPTMAEPFS